jgi:hypothetical protein
MVGKYSDAYLIFMVSSLPTLRTNDAIPYLLAT